MPDGFKVFADAVRVRFEEMSSEPKLFVVGVTKEEMWDLYLASFPEGSNPIFIKRTEHDCACCRHFIRDVGNVVAIQNGAISTVWDLNGLPDHYQAVADAMSAFIKSRAVTDVFLTSFPRLGNSSNVAMLSTGETTMFNHFVVNVPGTFKCSEIAKRKGELRTTHHVLLRGATDIAPEAITTVLDMIERNALYRGAEFKTKVLAFQKLQQRIMAFPEDLRSLVAWSLIDDPAARTRNSSIGTLMEDLTLGVDEEKAAEDFGKKLDPMNYKRPTATISKKMVENAMTTITRLGLEPALARRHARFSDVSVNSVLFVDNSVQGEMKGGIAGLLMEEVKPVKFDADKAEAISIDAFVETVLPKTTGLSLFLANTLGNNFVSMTAPVSEEVEPLFKWGNNFAWSYEGNLADSSIKSKVKSAGGQVEGVELRASLAWRNYDDLDLHVLEPGGGHIYFHNKSGSTGGVLDVDMNAGGGHTRTPVENIRWRKPPRDGVYKVMVHQYARRESVDVGFEMEIEYSGGLMHLSYAKGLTRDQSITVATITVDHGRVVSVVPNSGIDATAMSTEKWGLKTEQLVKVNSLVLSPNYWDENAVGNKHWFFILNGAKNDMPCRGIYNEFLNTKLEEHRKVFEVLGDKTKCPVADDQMSGVGFSSTGKGKVTVVATGPNLNKAYAIQF